MKTLSAKCPDCNRTICLPMMHCAVTHVTRTCTGKDCRARWFIRIEPISSGAWGAMHKVEFTRKNS